MAKLLLAKASLKSLIDKATRDDHNPTPGFLYNEINSKIVILLAHFIVNITFSSSFKSKALFL